MAITITNSANANHKKYIVRLSDEERAQLLALSAGEGSAEKRRRADILLRADVGIDGQSGWTDELIAESLKCSTRTVERAREALVTTGLEAALERKPRPIPPVLRKLDGEAEAKLIAMARGPAPEGRARWTYRLLADKLVELEIVESISHKTVWETLKKNVLKPHLKEYWCIPPEEDGEFVACMEDVLDVYQLPYDPKRPQVCMDEASKQLFGEVRDPIPMSPGQPERVDSEYERKGTANIFMFTEPLTGKVMTEVTDRRTMEDWAKQIKKLVDEYYPEAETIVLVNDNLNTHTIGSLYETFTPEEAHRIAKKLEIHYTPKHGSWLNIAEIELKALSVQCLDRRIESKENLKHEVAAWTRDRNEAVVGVDWRFTTEDARIRLKRLYPTVKQ